MQATQVKLKINDRAGDRITIYLSKENAPVLARIEQIAKKEKRSVSFVIWELCKKQLGGS